MGKRLFDFTVSFTGLLLLLPVLLIIAMAVGLTSKGGVVFAHRRVGRNNLDFSVYKFRTMHRHAERAGSLTMGNKDARITSVGRFLRKYKLDELPQLYNVLKGDMSLVGPRPEVRRYVDRYSEEELRVLSVRPGITDYASVEYYNEGEILDKADDPEKEYLEVVLPEKLKLALRYVREQSFSADLSILLGTLLRIFRT